MRLTSPSNPRIKRVLKLRKHRERRASGLLLAEGLREVARAVDAALVVHEIFKCPEALSADAARLAEADAIIGRGDASTAVVEVPGALFRRMTYRDDPEGLLAVCEAPRWSLDALPTVDGAALYLAAVETEKPGNLGAMVRTADTADCRAVLSVGAPVDVFNPNAIRASTGAVFALPTITLEQTEALDYLKREGVRLLAAAPDGPVRYDHADYRGPLAIAIGPEDRGLSRAWLEAADQCVSIPMHGRVADSLNAATAAAVLLCEAVRQRQGR